MSECGDNISASSGGALSAAEAEQLALRARRLYARELEAGTSGEMALQRVEDQLRREAQLMELVAERNRLLALRAKRNVKDVARRFPTLGEGLLAVIEGDSRTIEGSRFSVDYQSRANFGKYFGKLVGGLEEHDLLRDFMSNRHQADIFRELWELDREGGSPGRTGNEPAKRIARVIHDVGREMVARQNDAGAYIRLLPGYVMRQTHDIEAIRALGNFGTSKESQSESYRKWRDFVLPLLDHDATFEGLDPEFVLRNIHQGLYTGIHGPDPDVTQVSTMAYRGNHASKISRERVLHFSSADNAMQYNQQFGMKSLRDQVVADMRFRSRSMALMENFGPMPRQTFEQIKLELQADARSREDGAKQVDSLNSWKIEAAYNEVSGHNDHPVNHTLARVMNNIRMITMMGKMGGVVLSSFGDKGFLQAEMAYQGVSALETLGAQVTGMFARTKDRRMHLHLAGAALDGLLGNVMGRYTPFRPNSGRLSWLQKRFFDLNFMNWWNDANRATATELMSSHLAQHSELPHAELPMELRRVFNLYGIGPTEWDVLRTTAWSAPDGEHRFISPDQILMADEASVTRLLESRNMRDSEKNRRLVLRELETKLRTYLVDRTDFAVPSPGAAEHRLTTLNSQAGTPLGEAIRLLMMFKSFPITILQKTFGRELYGRGANTFMQWLMNDHKGKFAMAQIIAMTTIGGYLSGVVKDALKGRKPKPLITDGKIDLSTLNDAALRGGGLGIMGDMLFQDYDRQYHSFLGVAAGPVVGQLDPIADMYSRAKRGENVTAQAAKFVQNNTPFMNLFYVRPVLDYFVLWNLQEMMNPGSLRRAEKSVEKRGQAFFVRPSEHVNR